jgi:rubrerythrin
MGKFAGEVLEGSQTEALEAAGYVPFFAAGSAAAGEFFCSECGYGVSIQQRLPLCPMCGGAAWEQRKPSSA